MYTKEDLNVGKQILAVSKRYDELFQEMDRIVQQAKPIGFKANTEAWQGIQIELNQNPRYRKLISEMSRLNDKGITLRLSVGMYLDDPCDVGVLCPSCHEYLKDRAMKRYKQEFLNTCHGRLFQCDVEGLGIDWKKFHMTLITAGKAELYLPHILKLNIDLDKDVALLTELLGADLLVLMPLIETARDVKNVEILLKCEHCGHRFHKRDTTQKAHCRNSCIFREERRGKKINRECFLLRMPKCKHINEYLDSNSDFSFDTESIYV
jgi:hypothetical protein